jgi:molybdopterin-binding protein
MFFKDNRAHGRFSPMGRPVVASLLPCGKPIDYGQAHRPPARRKRVGWRFGMRLPETAAPSATIRPLARRRRRATRFIAVTPKGTAMKISARNQFKGKIIDVKKGATTAHVRLEIAPGQVITSSITNEAVDELGLKVGGSAIAIIKASNVMIAVD